MLWRVGIQFIFLLSISGVANAEIGASKTRRALLADQFKVLDSRLPRPKSWAISFDRPRISVPPKFDYRATAAVTGVRFYRLQGLRRSATASRRVYLCGW